MSEEQTPPEALGFERLTIDNWLEEVPYFKAFGLTSMVDGSFQPYTADLLARRFLIPQLADEIPIPIHQLFEVARGMMMYGAFFYPLYAAGIERLYLTAEAAVTRRYEDLGGKKRVRITFEENGEIKSKKTRATYELRLEWLRDRGVIPDEPPDPYYLSLGITTQGTFGAWTALRKLRNHVAHPRGQPIQWPKAAIDMLFRISERINCLFTIEPSL